MKILVAGVGNLLYGDDGFGVEVAHRLQRMELPAEVKVVETGIGGIHLVQEILAGFDAMIVIDCVDRGRSPGTVMIIEPEIEDVDEMSHMEKMDYLADMHYTKPSKALMLAKALNILPAKALLVGCQPRNAETYGEVLSPEVTTAVDVAVVEIMRLIDEFLADVEATEVRGG